MTKRAKQEANPSIHPGLPTLLGGLAVAVLAAALVAVAANAAPGQLPIRTKFLDRDVSHTTPDAALLLLDQAQAALEQRGVEFDFRGQRLVLSVDLTSPQDLGISLNYLGYDRETTGEHLASFGHTGNAFRDFWDRIRAYYGGAAVLPAVEVDVERTNAALDDLLQPYEQPAVNARFAVVNDSLTVTSEVAGTVFDRSALLAAASRALEQSDTNPIPVELRTDVPTVTAESLRPLLAEAQAVLAKGPLTLTSGDAKWEFPTSEVVGWLTARQGKLILNPAAVRASLAALSAAVAKEPMEPKFKIGTNGRVAEFQPATAGAALDLPGTVTALTPVVLGTANRTVAVALTVLEPKGSIGDSNTLGIKELVAEGRTSFAGSPPNRRFNIAVGASKLNGLIIKPGETFSLVSALVPIDAVGGYKQELVIKGNRTKPEYGGGLCQIGTTFFRLVINTGLPVVERQNHSYRVSYYEPPVGKDATIYDPKPDFRFTNDYTNPLLLQTEIAGNDLIFRFFGTKEKRDIVQTVPRLFNVVPPPPKKIIETTDIPVGTTKCLEHAHNGSDAEFTYTVTYPDGTTKSQLFKSHYKPWQEFCLIGVKSLPKVETPAPSTNTNAGSANTNATASKNTNTASSNSNASIEDISN